MLTPLRALSRRKPVEKLEFTKNLSGVVLVLLESATYWLWIWWAVKDLNHRPSRCKRDALTAELTAPDVIVPKARKSVNARSIAGQHPLYRIQVFLLIG